MDNLIKKCLFAAVMSLSVNGVYLSASECCDPCDSGRFYVGVFGGGAYSESIRASQLGTAFFTEAEGGPLAVFAEGNIKGTSTGFGGVQVGYEWSNALASNPCSNWTLAPAIELEAYFFSNRQKGHLINNTERLPEHDFEDSFHTDTSVILLNAVFTLNSPCLRGFSPYVGGGFGFTRQALHDASSIQTSPAELGVNHFNSQRHDSSWTFAGQIKAGIRYDICDSFHIFGEYRYLCVDTSRYLFGSTVYPTHVPTSPWDVKWKAFHYNAFAFGIQYDL